MPEVANNNDSTRKKEKKRKKKKEKKKVTKFKYRTGQGTAPQICKYGMSATKILALKWQGNDLSKQEH